MPELVEAAADEEEWSENGSSSSMGLAAEEAALQVRMMPLLLLDAKFPLLLRETWLNSVRELRFQPEAIFESSCHDGIDRERCVRA